MTAAHTKGFHESYFRSSFKHTNILSVNDTEYAGNQGNDTKADNDSLQCVNDSKQQSLKVLGALCFHTLFVQYVFNRFWVGAIFYFGRHCNVFLVLVGVFGEEFRKV